MAALKTVARSATVAFAPTAPDVLAMGTMAGAIDASFSATASLDIFKIDFSRSDSELDLISSYSSSEKFTSISWGNAGPGGEEYPYGLLAGGLDDGTVCVWNPASLIRQDPDTESSLIAKLQKHSGLVRGLEFNVLTPNILASGGDDGYVNIWDFKDPATPSHFPPLKGGGQDHIVDLSWNRKVAHIMATTSNTGVSVVWDLRRQKSVISFADSNNRRPCAAIEWNPENATQLIVASADDKFPTLQVWDLRNSMSPEKELVGHTKGVIAMGWCPIDSSLLLSSAKDYRTVCWDTVSGEIVCELPVSSNWNFDVQWSPRIAGVLSTSSYDGRVNLYNIEACSRILPSEGHFGGGTSSASMSAPKWLKRPAGVSFGFGGKLVSFASKKINVQTLVTEEELVNRSKDFETAIANHEDKSALRALCQRKAAESDSTESKEVWSFLSIMFEENARTSLLSHLGFVVPSVGGSDEEPSPELVEGVTADMAENLDLGNGIVEANDDGLGRLDSQADCMDDGADFFNNLSTPKGPISPQVIQKVESDDAEGVLETPDEIELEEEDDCDRTVQNALVIADFKDAVKNCLSENRMADALVLAHVGGPELWEETLAVYLKKHRRSYKKILAAVVARDAGSLVNSRPLNSWKETLALLCSYAGSEDWTMLSDALAARLDAAGYQQQALLCYICAANIEELARIWYNDFQSHANSTMFVKQLQDLMEKIVILALARGEKRVSSGLSRLLGSYVEILASQGLTSGAMEYLSFVQPEERSEELTMLLNRLSFAKQEDVKAATSAYTDNVQDTLVPRQAGGLQAFPATGPVYQSQEISMQPSQQTSFSQHSQGSSYSAYVPAQEVPYPQPGIFYPRPPALDRSQPPSGFNQQFIPPPVNSFTPVDSPRKDVSGGTVAAARSQFSNGGAGDWASNAYRPNPPPREFSPYPANMAPLLQQPAAPASTVESTPPVQATVTIENVSTSDVPADLKPVVVTLRRLFDETSEALGGAKANPAKKREILDNSRKIGALFSRLNKSDISVNARSKLIQICRCLDSRDYATAMQLQVSLTTSDWDECGSWLSPLKRMIKIRQTFQQ